MHRIQSYITLAIIFIVVISILYLPILFVLKKKGKEKGFKILQFNAVVKTNTSALKLYKKLGFTQLGIIPNGFLLKNGNYEDIIPHYITL